jgi:hypothetical protein
VTSVTPPDSKNFLLGTRKRAEELKYHLGREIIISFSVGWQLGKKAFGNYYLDLMQTPWQNKPKKQFLIKSSWIGF